MTLGSKASMWSRETTAESRVNDTFASPAALRRKTSGATCSESAALRRLLMSKDKLEGLLTASVRGLPFAVTIVGKSKVDGVPVFCAVSRGAEEMYERPQSAWRGVRALHIDAPDNNFEVAAKLISARLHGAEAAVIQTQSKASGSVFKAYQYLRGLSLGSEPESSQEVWYSLTVTFNITPEFERESEGIGHVDYDFFKESAISVAKRVRSNITNAISELSYLRSYAAEGISEEPSSASLDSDDEWIEDDTSFVQVTTPSWVAYPPESIDIRNP